LWRQNLIGTNAEAIRLQATLKQFREITTSITQKIFRLWWTTCPWVMV